MVVGVTPDQPARVLKVAAKHAALLGAPLVIVNVDVMRFVTYEDPDGIVHSAPLDMDIDTGSDDLASVTQHATQLLEGQNVRWSVQQLVGDPAIALKKVADQTDARIIVVGTRRRGFGESVREFFTGSVAARLAHRQLRPVLVVPLGEPVADDEDVVWGEERAS
ncbi:universal stress protein UspA [Microbacterium mangrovi]|uniref:Universal stress protein UspA n=1 Tax=Microbacterium mangrovi TaxID=1348253 RepID=A0A0B2A2I1_9MICO|nr:universal stress protein UspA [Microbacterium mangrovi]